MLTGFRFWASVLSRADNAGQVFSWTTIRSDCSRVVITTNMNSTMNRTGTSDDESKSQFSSLQVEILCFIPYI